MSPALDQSQARGEVAYGAALAATPLWSNLLHDVNLIASTIAAVAGAIIAVHGVYRIVRRHWCDR